MLPWILTILYLGGKLERTADRLDERITAIALDPFGDTMRQYDKICALNDLKRRVVNMQVLSHRLRWGAGDGYDWLRQCMEGMSYARIGEQAGVSKATAYRRIKRAAARCTGILSELGFDADRLHRDYDDIRLVKRTYDCFVRWSSRAAELPTVPGVVAASAGEHPMPAPLL